MKLACQADLTGQTEVLAQFTLVQKWSFAGVELTPWKYLEGDRAKYALSLEEDVKTAMDKTGLPVTTICGGLHFDFLNPDPAKRRADFNRLSLILRLAGRIGATGVIMVPIFNGAPQLPDLMPLRSSVDLQRDLLIAELRTMATVAEDSGSCVILEPLNRYEAPWFNRLEQAAAICDEINSPGVGFMADLFHMNIEETNPAAAIITNARWLRHIHLADNTRKQPGTGTTDFASIFRALKDIGYSGAMALECSLTSEPSEALPACVHYLKTQMGLDFIDR
jgi:sugar phosphate isomerase/epimerase